MEMRSVSAKPFLFRDIVMNHKRGRPKNARAGCLLCKPNKANGVNKTVFAHYKFGYDTLGMCLQRLQPALQRTNHILRET
jgi:hypothetical protein